MVEDTRSWPVGLRRLAEMIGPAAAVRLAEVFGGLEDIYIPITATPTHAFTGIIGLDRLEALCVEFGSKRIDIPRGTFRDLKKTRIMDASGSNREVALRLGVTQRYVRKVRAEVRPNDQADLFAEKD